jgi:hypothetical protein
MGYLIALGLLIAFSAALLNPYGRRLLATMFLVVCGVGLAWYILYRLNNPVAPLGQKPARAGMSDGELFADAASNNPGAVSAGDAAQKLTPKQKADYCAGHRDPSEPPDPVPIGLGCSDTKIAASPKRHDAVDRGSSKDDLLTVLNGNSGDPAKEGAAEKAYEAAFGPHDPSGTK